jgi:hypothetical protein
MNVTVNALAAKAMAAVKKAERLSPEKHFALMVASGLIDEQGRVSKELGGTANTKLVRTKARKAR